MRALTFRLASLPLLAAAGLASAACNGAAAGPPPVDQKFEVVQSKLARDAAPSVTAVDAAQLSTDNLRFAFDLYPGIVKDETSNQFYSPYSVSLALAMTYAGTAGSTATQLAKAMHFDLPAARLHPAFDQLDLALRSRAAGNPGSNGQGFHLDLADSLWGERTLTFAEPFLDTLAVDYGAGLRVTDFINEPGQALDAINGWVSGDTNGKIPDLLPPGSITTDTRFVLVNAIYFDAGWASPFDAQKTKAAPFTRLDGSKVQAPTMQQNAELTYAEGPGYQAVELPYAGGETSMVVVLPKQGSFASVEKELTGDFAGSVFKGLQIAQVNVSLPKFIIHAPTFSVAKQLEKLGMVDAFDATKANFTSMLSSTQGRFWISDVLQQAYVSVDEKGTEAAAATAVVGVGTAAVVKQATIAVDRPFLFVIRDIPTDTALFVGRVLDPTK